MLGRPTWMQTLHKRRRSGEPCLRHLIPGHPVRHRALGRSPLSAPCSPLPAKKTEESRRGTANRRRGRTDREQGTPNRDRENRIAIENRQTKDRICPTGRLFIHSLSRPKWGFDRAQPSAGKLCFAARAEWANGPERSQPRATPWGDVSPHGASPARAQDVWAHLCQAAPGPAAKRELPSEWHSLKPHGAWLRESLGTREKFELADGRRALCASFSLKLGSASAIRMGSYSNRTHPAAGALLPCARIFARMRALLLRNHPSTSHYG